MQIVLLTFPVDRVENFVDKISSNSILDSSEVSFHLELSFYGVIIL